MHPLPQCFRPLSLEAHTPGSVPDRIAEGIINRPHLLRCFEHSHQSDTLFNTKPSSKQTKPGLFAPVAISKPTGLSIFFFYQELLCKAINLFHKGRNRLERITIISLSACSSFPSLPSSSSHACVPALLFPKQRAEINILVNLITAIQHPVSGREILKHRISFMLLLLLPALRSSQCKYVSYPLERRTKAAMEKE